MSNGERRAESGAGGAKKSSRSNTDPGNCGKAGGKGPPKRRGPRDRYAALDLGTNNCRLLIAAPDGRRFRIVDAFSRIVRLGEGVSAAGRLSDAAMDRALAAISVCADKIRQRGVTHSRCIATQACRSAQNGEAFLARVQKETGLEFEVIAPEEEANLAVAGCVELVDPKAKSALVFDIGGGSTELSWLRPNTEGVFETAAWMSMPIGVVSLSEKWGGRALSIEDYENAVGEVRAALQDYGDPSSLKSIFDEGAAHLLGTSGTVTSIAGVHLELPRYRRDRVDGLWLAVDDVRAVTEKLRAMSFDERAAEPCIGEERADLVVCGCAILEALLREWPAGRIRVADRGLREGILWELARKARRQRRRGRRKRTRPKTKS